MYEVSVLIAGAASEMCIDVGRPNGWVLIKAAQVCKIKDVCLN